MTQADESTLDTVRRERDLAEREVIILRAALRNLAQDLQDRLLPVHTAEMIALEAVDESEKRLEIPPLQPDIYDHLANR